MRYAATLMLAASMFTLAACGENQSDRAVSGAGIGAGVGAVGAAVTGGSPVAGAVIGGVAGGATGALTSPNDIDLGKPAWR